VRLAIHGRFSFTDDQLAEAAHNIVQKERAFWGDPSAAPFLVTLAPVDGEPGMRGVGGSAFRDAFGAAASPDTPLYRLLLNFAHETFHTGQKGRTSLTETWFVEGFADAYSRVLSLRAGDLSMDEFIDVWNEALVDYANSPARTWPNDRVVAERFSDADADGMPYIRGALLATIWDRRLHNATKGARSLDDVLREHRRATNGASETAGALFAKIAASSGLDISADIATHIDRGEPISLPPDAFGPCIRVDDLAIASFDRGFDAEATMRAGMVASGVRTDGPAHAAGLRDGMKLVRQAGGRFGDSTLDYVWIVQAHGDAEQTLRWRPAGQGELHIQRLVRTDMSPSDARSCALG
jgi:predicted metalloprotease with PDZ domain